MTAREYLSQARMIDARINSKLIELQRIRELATRATGTVSDRLANPGAQFFIVHSTASSHFPIAVLYHSAVKVSRFFLQLISFYNVSCQ